MHVSAYTCSLLVCLLVTHVYLIFLTSSCLLILKYINVFFLFCYSDETEYKRNYSKEKKKTRKKVEKRERKRFANLSNCFFAHVLSPTHLLIQVL